MPQRAAFSCNHRRDRKQYGASGVAISFHKFPINKSALSKQWLHNIRRSVFALSRFNNILCSMHLTTVDVYELCLGHVSNRQGGQLIASAHPSLTSTAHVHWYASCAPNADVKWCSTYVTDTMSWRIAELAFNFDEYNRLIFRVIGASHDCSIFSKFYQVKNKI